MEIKNNTMIRTLYIILLGITLSKIDPVSSCDWTSVAKCHDILTRAGTDMLSKGISTMPTKGQLKTLCSVWTEFKQCFKPYSSGCVHDSTFEMTYGTLENIFEYLCVEGFDDYLRFEWCWLKEGVNESLIQCKSTMDTASTALKQNIGRLGAVTVKRQLCVLMSDVTKCFRDAVVGCGAGPECFLKTFMDRSLAILLQKMGCPSAAPCTIPDTNSTADVSNKETTIPETTISNKETTIFDIYNERNSPRGAGVQNKSSSLYIFILLFTLTLSSILS